VPMPGEHDAGTARVEVEGVRFGQAGKGVHGHNHIELQAL